MWDAIKHTKWNKKDVECFFFFCFRPQKKYKNDFLFKKIYKKELEIKKITMSKEKLPAWDNIYKWTLKRSTKHDKNDFILNKNLRMKINELIRNESIKFIILIYSDW